MEDIIKIDKIAIGSSILLLLIHLVITALLPDSIPSDFDSNFEPHTFVSKYHPLLFIFPIFAIVFTSIFTFLKYHVSQKKYNGLYDRNYSSCSVTTVIVSYFSWVFSYALIISNSELNFNVFKNLFLVPAVVSIIFIVGGIMMRFVKPNVWLGLRTTDTLSNEKMWSTVNKKTGVVMIYAGFFILTGSLYIDDDLMRLIFVMITVAIISVISLLIVKTEKQNP
ncbi:MAG: hypothetical protein E7Z66_01750 [Thermoplasmata archaeon]|nr:hypothetical protein [Thermoplasmata archaeon]